MHASIAAMAIREAKKVEIVSHIEHINIFQAPLAAAKQSILRGVAG
jgi:hypothetical protein